MGPFRDVPVLQGALVRLEPLSGRHGADLADAAEEDRSAYGFTWVPRRDEIDDYLHSQFQRAVEGKLIPFAQIRMTDQRAVGLYRLRQSAHLAQPDGDQCRRDRLDLARRHGATLRDQCRIQVAPVHPCVRPVGGGPGRHQDRRRAMRSPVAPSRAWAPTSRACSGAGRNRGLPAKRAGCAIPPCIPSWRRNGRHVGSTSRIGSPASADEDSAGSIDSRLAHDHHSRRPRPDGPPRGFPARHREVRRRSTCAPRASPRRIGSAPEPALVGSRATAGRRSAGPC